jgi:LysM repeat protein
MTIAPTAAAPIVPSPTPVYHEVQTGDTAWAIAARYDVSVDGLLGLNNLDANPVLTPGQRLFIPPRPAAGSTAEADTLAGTFDGRRVAGIPDEPSPAVVVRPEMAMMAATLL